MYIRTLFKLLKIIMCIITTQSAHLLYLYTYNRKCSIRDPQFIQKTQTFDIMKHIMKHYLLNKYSIMAIGSPLCSPMMSLVQYIQSAVQSYHYVNSAMRQPKDRGFLQILASCGDLFD